MKHKFKYSPFLHNTKTCENCGSLEWMIKNGYFKNKKCSGKSTRDAKTLNELIKCGKLKLNKEQIKIDLDTFENALNCLDFK